MISPTTLLLTFAAAMIFLFFGGVHRANTPFELLDYILNSFFHADLPHLMANLFSLLRVGSVIQVLNVTEILKMLIFLLVVSSGLLYLVHALFPQTKKHTIGFSGVIFGLIVVRNVLLGGDLQTVAVDVMIQLLPDLATPGVSFAGHLTGAIAGFLYLLLTGNLNSASLMQLTNRSTLKSV